MYLLTNCIIDLNKLTLMWWYVSAVLLLIVPPAHALSFDPTLSYVRSLYFVSCTHLFFFNLFSNEDAGTSIASCITGPETLTFFAEQYLSSEENNLDVTVNSMSNYHQ